MMLLARFSSYHQTELSSQKIRYFTQILGEEPANLSQHFPRPISRYHLAKFGRLTFCDIHEWRPAKKQNAAFTESGYFSHLWTQLCEILGKCREPLIVSNAVVRLSI